MFEDLKNPDWFRVMGIDPSTTNMGVAVIDVNIKNPALFKLVYANTIYGEKVCYDIPDQFDDLAATRVLARSYGLHRSLKGLVEILEPDTGICEDNFMGASPLTFKQLIQCVALIRQSFTDNEVHLSYVLPNPAKDVVGANFKGTTKDDVKAGLLKYGFLDSGEIDLSVLDEHSVDAVAVTLYRCEQLAKDYEVWPAWITMSDEEILQKRGQAMWDRMFKTP